MRAFYALLGAGLCVGVVEDLALGQLGIHEGTLFPLRHLVAAIPLLPPWAALALWGARALAGAGLALDHARGHRTLWARLAAATLLVSLTQTFQNQKLLQLIVCVFLSLEAPAATLAPAARRAHPVVWLLRCQLLIVYLFSALNKIYSGFLDGRTVAATFSQVLLMPDGALAPRILLETLARPDVARAASLAVAAAELVLPVALLKAPRVGFAAVCVLHLGFTLCMPGLWPFSITMVALAALFVTRSPAR